MSPLGGLACGSFDIMSRVRREIFIASTEGIAECGCTLMAIIPVFMECM